MINEKNFTLTIKDNIYFVSNVFYLILGVVGILIFKIPPIVGITESHSNNVIGYTAVIMVFITGLFGLFHFFYADKTIKFNESNIYINPTKSILLNDVKEIYRISFLYSIDIRFGVRRYNILSKSILILITPILSILFLLNIIFKKIYYRNNNIHDILVLIANNDKEMVLVQLPLKNQSEQDELEDYCKKYLDTDIAKIKTKFFIPNN